jgi:hypothetical protein
MMNLIKLVDSDKALLNEKVFHPFCEIPGIHIPYWL